MTEQIKSELEKRLEANGWEFWSNVPLGFEILPYTYRFPNSPKELREQLLRKRDWLNPLNFGRRMFRDVLITAAYSITGERAPSEWNLVGVYVKRNPSYLASTIKLLRNIKSIYHK